LLTSLSSLVSIGYMDNFTLGGREGVVVKDIVNIVVEGERIGFHLNTSKCEVIHAADTRLSSDLLNSFAHRLRQDAT
jgi:hypothetical protein